MTYYINSIWFYLMNVLDLVHWLFPILGTFAILFGAVGLAIGQRKISSVNRMEGAP